MSDRKLEGVASIAAERERQKTVEGWTPEHDDTHRLAEMIGAAANYIDFARFQIQTGRTDGEAFFRNMPPMLAEWPRTWNESWWKPSADPIRNLVKAGALIAAEIDRLQRLAAAAK